MRVEGVRIYGRAIEEMARGLTIPGRARSDGMLAAVKLVAIFEVRSRTKACILPRVLTFLAAFVRIG